MRAQVDMKIVYLALSLVMLGIFIQVVWPMVTGAQKTAEKEICRSEWSIQEDLNDDGIICNCPQEYPGEC